MKYPAVITSLAVLAATLLFILIGRFWLPLVFALIFAVFAIFLLIFKRKTVKGVFLIVLTITLAATALSSAVRLNFLEAADEYRGEIFNLNGEVLTTPELTKSGEITFIIKDENITNGTIKVTFSEVNYLNKIKIGDKIEAEAVGEKERPSNNDFSKGITLKCFLPYGIKVITNENRPLTYYGELLAKRCGDIIREKVGGETGMFAAAMLTGKNLPEGKSTENFRTSGISHYFSVSGFHLAVLSGVILFFAKVLRLNNKLTVILVLVASIFGCFFAGFAIPTIRAAVMTATLAVSTLILRKGSSLNTICIITAVFLIVNPTLIYSVSFLLSFSAVFGIIVFSNLLIKFLKKFENKENLHKILKVIMPPVFISLGATLFTFPASFLFFGYLPVYSVITNLLTSFAVSVLFVFILILVFVSEVPVLCEIIATLVRAITNLVTGIATFISSLPAARLYLSFEITVLVLLAIACVIIIIKMRNRLKFKIIPIALAVALIVSSVVIFIPKTKIAVIKDYNFSGVAITNGATSMLYLFEQEENADYEEFLLKNGFSNCKYVITPNEITENEINIHNLSVEKIETEDGTALFIEAENETVLILPNNFSLKNIYKSAVCDIIVSGGNIKDPEYLYYSEMKMLITLDNSFYRRSELFKIANEVGAEFKDVSESLQVNKYLS